MEALRASTMLCCKPPPSSSLPKCSVFGQVSVSCLWAGQGSRKIRSLKVGRLYSTARNGSQEDGSSVAEDDRKEQEKGLLLGAQRDGSGSVVGFHLIPQSGM